MLSNDERDADCVYLCGNSLGLQPKGTQVLVNEELIKWQRRYDYSVNVTLTCCIV